jgi:asparagine synthase (glutamine-hydrolysing)
LAHEAGLKVALSGLGGDELFGSYPSFEDVPRWQHAAATLAALPGAAALTPTIARLLRPSQPKLQGLVRYGRTLAGAYLLRRGIFLPHEIPSLLPRALAEEGLAAYDSIGDAERFAGSASDPWLAVHAMESGLYMRNQLLRDSDWASMAHGLELRVPLVDAVLERDVAGMGFEPGRSLGKAVVVASAAPMLPSALFSRPKTGFGLPLEWLDDSPGTSPSYGSRRARATARGVARTFGMHLQERRDR